MPKEGGSSKRPRKKTAKSSAKTTQSRADAKKLIDDRPSEKPGFTPRTLDRSVIAIPLLRDLVMEEKTKRRKPHDVVIDLHLEFPGGRDLARQRVRDLLMRLRPRAKGARPVLRTTTQYMFATMYGNEIRELVRLDRDTPVETPAYAVTPEEKEKKTTSSSAPRAIFRIWPDFKVKALLVKTVSTVKADAAHSSFAAYGTDIVWAVVDSCVDVTHKHFAQY